MIRDNKKFYYLFFKKNMLFIIFILEIFLFSFSSEGSLCHINCKNCSDLLSQYNDEDMKCTICANGLSFLFNTTKLSSIEKTSKKFFQKLINISK